jgi:hypothetical protein
VPEQDLDAEQDTLRHLGDEGLSRPSILGARNAA